MGAAPTRQREAGESLHLALLPAVLLIVATIVALKALALPNLLVDPIFGFYSLAVTTYILSSFALASLYRPSWAPGPLPSVTAVIPVKNEERIIGETIARYALCRYPRDRLELIVVDDGSTDATWAAIEEAWRRWNPLRPGWIEIHRFPENRGKRAALAHGFRRAKGELVVVTDSDSLVDPEGLREIVRPFVDPRVAGAAGHTEVANAEASLLTRLQAGRYYVAFRVYKAVEALTGTVICLSGSFSAYRRRALLEVLEAWENQTFLGVPCTYGDDRGLTTYLLRRGYRTVYVPTARAVTQVPEALGDFWRQQLRWKKSWIRETWLAAPFMWRRHPLAALRFYTSAFLTLLSFVVVARVLFYLPLVHGQPPWAYLGGLGLIALLYALYYRMHRATRLWSYALLWSLLYTFVLVWQVPLALATLRDPRWGTR